MFYIFRTPFPKNTSGRLLLYCVHCGHETWRRRKATQEISKHTRRNKDGVQKLLTIFQFSKRLKIAVFYFPVYICYITEKDNC